MGPLWTHSCPLLPSLSVALQWHTFVHTEIWHDFQICFLWNLKARNPGAGNAMSLSLFVFFHDFTLPLAWHQSLCWHFNVVLYKFKIIVLSEQFCLCSFVYAVINPWNLLYFLSLLLFITITKFIYLTSNSHMYLGGWHLTIVRNLMYFSINHLTSETVILVPYEVK